MAFTEMELGGDRPGLVGPESSHSSDSIVVQLVIRQIQGAYRQFTIQPMNPVVARRPRLLQRLGHQQKCQFHGQHAYQPVATHAEQPGVQETRRRLRAFAQDRTIGGEMIYQSLASGEAAIVQDDAGRSCADLANPQRCFACAKFVGYG